MTITIKKDLKLSTTDISNSNIIALTATYGLGRGPDKRAHN